MRGKTFGLGMLVLGASLLLTSEFTPVLAQGATGIEEIIVTARRREESLQTVPVAVTAFSGEDLRGGTLSDISSIANLTPGYNTLGGPGDGNFSPTIRGHFQTDPTAAGDPAVPVIIDEVYYGFSHGQLANSFDIQSVQVLKGPQGTTFGRNTTGGLLVVSTNRPVLGEFEGLGNVKLGNEGRNDYNLMLNLPLIDDELAFRGVIVSKNRNGFFRSTVTGQEQKDEELKSVRGSLLWEPTDATKITVVGDYLQTRNGAIPFLFNRAIGPTLTIAAGLEDLLVGGDGSDTSRATCSLMTVQELFDDRETCLGANTASEIDTWGVVGIFEHDFSDTLGAKFITSYRDAELNAHYDTDASNITGVDPNLIDGGTQYQAEFQVFGDNDVVGLPVSWLGGAFFFTQDATSNSDNYTLPVFGSPYQPSRRVVGEDNQSVAGYFQMDVEVAENTRLTAGTRYTRDTKEQSSFFIEGLFASEAIADAFAAGSRAGRRSVPGFTVNYNPAFPGAVSTGAFSLCRFDDAILDDPSDPNNCTVTRQDKYDAFTWTFGADREFLTGDEDNDLFAYVRYARGFKAGRQNVRGAGAELAFTDVDPEIVDNYEFGLKGDWMGGVLRTNLSGFYQEYTDIQLQVIALVGGVAGSIQENAGSATYWGGELEVEAVPFENFWIRATGAYINQEWDEFFDFSGPGGTLRDRRDEKFVNTPEWTASISAQYTHPVDYGDYSVRVDYSWRDMVFHDADKGDLDIFQQEAFALVNARAALQMSDPNLELALFCQNCANKAYVNSTSDLLIIGHATGNPGQPRTWGAEITWRFGGGS